MKETWQEWDDTESDSATIFYFLSCSNPFSKEYLNHHLPFIQPHPALSLVNESADGTMKETSQEWEEAVTRCTTIFFRSFSPFLISQEHVKLSASWTWNCLSGYTCLIPGTENPFQGYGTEKHRYFGKGNECFCCDKCTLFLIFQGVDVRKRV